MEQMLKSAGLKESEIKVYLHLLQNGLATPPQISKGTGMARPNCYSILQTLKEKGLITLQTQGKRKAYMATDPSALIHAMEMKTEAMKRLLPDLRAMYAKQAQKPSIKFFEGAEQVKEIFTEMLEAKEVYGVASTKKLYEALSPEYFKMYIKKMREKNIILKDILTKDSVDTSAPTPIGTLKNFYEYRVLPENSGDIPVDILLWDDKVAFISVEAPVFGTLIRHAAIAKMLKIMFGFSWKQLS